MQPRGTKNITQPLGTKKITQPLGATENHKTSRKKITQPLGTKNKIMQQREEKKSRNLLGQKKSSNLSGQTKIMQPFATTKNHATSKDKKITQPCKGKKLRNLLG